MLLGIYYITLEDLRDRPVSRALPRWTRSSMMGKQRKQKAAAPENTSEITKVDRIIHEPARLLILWILSAADKADFLFLQREAELSRGNLSSHISKLEQAGYVKVTKTYHGKSPATLINITETGRNRFEEYSTMIIGFLESRGI
ncbi:MAG: winged helix-turn-helix domain-containing protein [Spirochaetia bacterium]